MSECDLTNLGEFIINDFGDVSFDVGKLSLNPVKLVSQVGFFIVGVSI